MKDGIINSCKKLKVLYDTYKIIRVVILFLGLASAGGLGHFAIDTTVPAPEYASAPSKHVEPALDNAVKVPEYALKNHVHVQSKMEIKKAIVEYDKQHDPKKLQH